MNDLSPAARAVLEAVTWKKYDVPPEGLPAFAEEMAPLIAAALRAAANHMAAWSDENDGRVDLSDLLDIADELEGAPD